MKINTDKITKNLEILEKIKEKKRSFMENYLKIAFGNEKFEHKRIREIKAEVIK